jgi:DNA polymerase I-like protein with 3'-5' exonuclease and polymerase domains
VEGCKKNGFVETLAGRRRYLPHVDHRSVAVRSKFWLFCDRLIVVGRRSS